MKFLLSLSFLLVLQIGATAQTGVYKICGNTTTDFSGDTGPAIDAGVGSVSGLTVDNDGAIYFCDDWPMHVIRKIDPNGIITTIAGNAVWSDRKVKGLGIHNMFFTPSDIELDGKGNLYVADRHHSIVKINLSSGIVEPLIDSFGISPHTIALDGNGNLYFRGYYATAIHKLDLATGVVSTIAGNYVDANTGDGGPAINASIGNGHGFAVDPWGNIYIQAGGLIRKIDAITGIITTVAGNGTVDCAVSNGPALQTPFTTANYLCTDSIGDLYIGSYSCGKIWKLDVRTSQVTHIAGTLSSGSFNDGTPPLGAYMHPYGIEVRNGKVYFSTVSRGQIKSFSIFPAMHGNIVSQTNVGCTGVGTGVVTVSGIHGSPPYQYKLGNGTFQSSGSFSGLAVGNHIITVKDVNGITSPLKITITAGQPAAPIADFIYNQTDNYNVEFISNTRYANSILWQFPGGTTATANRLTHNFSSAGTYTVKLIAFSNCQTDTFTQSITVSPIPVVPVVIKTIAGTGIGNYSGDGGPAVLANVNRPWGMAADTAGNLYFADELNHVVRKIAANGIITTIAGTGVWGSSGNNGPAIQAQLKAPTDVALDNQNNLYICDRSDLCIRKLNLTTGIIQNFAGTPGVIGVTGDGGPATSALFASVGQMAFDPAFQNLYIVDRGIHGIRKINIATNIITTISGGIYANNTNDSVPAVDAKLLEPYAIGIDNTGNIYITERDYVKKIDGITGMLTRLSRDVHPDVCMADSLPHLQAYLSTAYGVGIDNQNNVYVTETGRGHIHKINLQTGYTSVFAGNGVLEYSGNNNDPLYAGMMPRSIEIVGNKIYISDWNNYIRVIERPVLSGNITAQTNAGCNGSATGSVTVQGSSGIAPYQYSLNNGPYQLTGTFTGLATGTHTVTIKDTVGNLYPVTVIVTNSGTPPIANFTYNQIDNYNVNFTNTSTNTDSVLWIFPGNVTDTATNPTFNFPVEGNYNVTLIAYNGCGADTIIIPVQVNKLSAVSENTVQQFTLYPNPAGDDITIQLQSAERVNGTLQLVNVLGQVVYNERIDFNSTYTKTLDVSRLAKGLYVLCLQTEKGSITRKLVIE